MMLLIGGANQGKLEIALRLTGCARDAARPGGEIVDKLHWLIREVLEQGGDLDALLQQMLTKQAVICDEIGCGIVPADALERRWRDEVGRACQALAARAQQVIRVTCGIPIYLKGAPDELSAK